MSTLASRGVRAPDDALLVTRTPLRVSLAGGGSDLRSCYGMGRGCVVTTAIDQHVYVALGERPDGRISLACPDEGTFEVVEHIDEVRHDLVREALLFVGGASGLAITITADAPPGGSGLGSSSSLTVGLLHALHARRGDSVTAEQLAREACIVEIDRCGRPIGKQDQYIAAFGGLRFFEFGADEQVWVEDLGTPVARRLLGERLSLFFTNRTRNAATILAEQAVRSNQNRATLDGLIRLAEYTREAIRDARYDEVGALLREGWFLKRTLASGITNPDLDAMAERAMEAGALGCRLCGAGGGGFLLAYAPPDRHSSISQALAGFRKVPVALWEHGSQVLDSMGGR
jgi:D-glycero-alpha-D-manno-heptose-7-phosphate kinase